MDLWERINRRLHAIVDEALQGRSLALYDQYLRDVEAYGRQIELSAARIYAGTQANQRRLIRYQEIVERLDARIDELILAGDEDRARILLAELAAEQELVAATEAQIAKHQADHERLLSGREQTQDRLRVLRRERPAVEGLMAALRAHGLIETIELALGSLAELGQESAVGRIAEGVQRRLDEAEIRWELAQADLAFELEEAERAGVDDQLAERMLRLGMDAA